MGTTKNTLNEKEMELVKYLVSDCRTTGDVQEKLKRLFAGTIEQIYSMVVELADTILSMSVAISFSISSARTFNLVSSIGSPWRSLTDSSLNSSNFRTISSNTIDEFYDLYLFWNYTAFLDSKDPQVDLPKMLGQRKPHDLPLTLANVMNDVVSGATPRGHPEIMRHHDEDFFAEVMRSVHA